MLFLFLIFTTILSFHTLERSPTPMNREVISKFRTRLNLKHRNVRKKLLRRLKEFEFDIVGYDKDDDVLSFLSNREEIETLKRCGFEFISSVDRKREVGEEDDDFSTQSVFDGFFKLNEINEYLEEVEMEVDQARVFDLLAEYGQGGRSKTWEGRKILGLELRKSKENNLPNILVVANHHAREFATPEMVLGMIEYILEEGYDYLNEYNFYMIPVLNVDGYEYVFNTDVLWRKNRRKFEDSECVGVDLNRNYDTGFGMGTCDSKDVCSETYHGLNAFSEPETMGMKNLIEEMKFVKVLDFHSMGREVLWGYPSCGGDGFPYPEQLGKYMSEIAEDLASFSTVKYGTRNPYGPGEHQEYELKTSSLYSLLIEVLDEYYPSHEKVLEEFEIILPLIERFLEFPIPLMGIVRDLDTGEVLEGVSLDVKEVDFSEFTRVTDERGIYHLFLPEGEWTVVFAMKGYEDVEIKIGIEKEKELRKDIFMTAMVGFDEGLDKNIRRKKRKRRRRRKEKRDGSVYRERNVEKRRRYYTY